MAVDFRCVKDRDFAGSASPGRRAASEKDEFHELLRALVADGRMSDQEERGLPGGHSPDNRPFILPERRFFGAFFTINLTPSKEFPRVIAQPGVGTPDV